MQHFKILFLFIFLYSGIKSQDLKPFIGLAEVPKLSDTMCAIQDYLGSFEDSGYQLGDTVNDFTIYNLDFQAFSLSETLRKGKPVLLISSSYTCPVFRDKISAINTLADLYKDQLEIFVVYTVEAHPDKDISPYFGKIHTGSRNINEGILYRQPVLYSDRMQIVTDMLNQLTLDVPVFIDGPCNEWWNHFGPAPNNATLIDPGGIVRIKHAWFDREPDNIICDVKKYFDPNSICDSIASGNSQFEFTMNTDTIVQGEVNAVLYVSGKIKNISNDPVKIEIRRLQNVMPANWSSSICLDVCYSTTIDSTMITLKANEEIDLIIDFFTGPDPAQGYVQIGIKNVDHNKNRAFMNARAVTRDITKTHDENDAIPDVMIYPQPSISFLHINTDSYNHYVLFDEKGTVYQSGGLDATQIIERKNIPSGIYILKLSHHDGKTHYQKIIFN